MSEGRKTALAVLVAAAFAVFVLPAGSASAGSATTPNACANSVTANFSQIGVTTNGDDGLTTVAPGGTTTTTGLSQNGAVPGAIFVAGYNLGLLVVGPNNIPATVNTKIEGTNTTQGTQTTNNAATAVSTTISDPDGTPGTGDETGTDATFNTTYNNLTWTAGASGTINYRQDSIPAWPATDANNTLRIQAVVGGFLNVIFRCAPGTVTPPDPGTVALIDPAGSFDTTTIQAANTAPTADAGDDQTVDSGAMVQLDGTGSTDPENDTLTYEWTQTSGPTVTLDDPTSATPTFTAPTGPATLTFDLTVCDPDAMCDADTVVVTVPGLPGSRISIDNASVTEGGTASFTVSLDAPSTNPVTVDFATANDTAVAPDDYTAATGTVTFAPGDTSEPVTVQTIDDNLLEGTETFAVNLSNATGNATIADAIGVGTIIDNDIEPPHPPMADASADQTVASGATVQLDGSGSIDPQGQPLTYMWTQTSGPAVTLSDPTAVMPTFTAPTGPATLTFELQVCDPQPVCDTDSVTINVQAPPVIDATGIVILNGPVSSTKTSKSFTFKVSNIGVVPITVNPLIDISSSVDVNGTPTGLVTPNSGAKTLSPGASTKVKLVWSYAAGALAMGDSVVFQACVNVAGDVDTTNDCDNATATAR